MHAYYMRMWECVACAHAVIYSGHTRFLVQGLLTDFSTTQITIQLGIQTSQTHKPTILSTIVSFLSRNQFLCIVVSSSLLQH